MKLIDEQHTRDVEVRMLKRHVKEMQEAIAAMPAVELDEPVVAKSPAPSESSCPPQPEENNVTSWMGTASANPLEDCRPSVDGVSPSLERSFDKSEEHPSSISALQEELARKNAIILSFVQASHQSARGSAFVTMRDAINKDKTHKSWIGKLKSKVMHQSPTLRADTPTIASLQGLLEEQIYENLRLKALLDGKSSL